MHGKKKNVASGLALPCCLLLRESEPALHRLMEKTAYDMLLYLQSTLGERLKNVHRKL